MFRLVASYDLLESRRINDFTVDFFTSLLPETNRFHVAVRLFSNRPQKMSKYDKNKKVAQGLFVTRI